MKILIVDDEINIVHAIRRDILSFADRNKLEILTSTSPVEALKILEKEANVAIIISDQKMPELTGNEFLLRVKKMYPDIISIILTGYQDTKAVIEAVKVEVFAYLLKPWDKNKLVMEIKKALHLYKLRFKNKYYLSIIKNELKWAGELQKTLLKRDIPRSEKIKFSITYLPLPNLKCGGDYYDIVYINDQMYISLLGDVSGHGIKAAFITAMLKSIIYSGYIAKHRTKNFSPADFLTWLNKRVCKELLKIPDIIITFIVCFIDLEKMRLIYSNAGHIPFFIIRNNTLIKSKERGPGMGFIVNSEYTDTEIEIHNGDKIILYTDGLSEKMMNQRNINVAEIFLEHAKKLQFNDFVISNIKDHFPNKKFIDDITLISIDIE